MKSKIVLKGVWVDKYNELVIIDGVAQRDIKPGEELFCYDDVL